MKENKKINPEYAVFALPVCMATGMIAGILITMHSDAMPAGIMWGLIIGAAAGAGLRPVIQKQLEKKNAN